MNETVLFVLLDDYADWEAGSLAAALNEEPEGEGRRGRRKGDRKNVEKPQGRRRKKGRQRWCRKLLLHRDRPDEI